MALMTEDEIPLFPLMTVLFPGGPLPLRIFETRYLDMVSQCLRESRPFGVLRIVEGGETGRASLADYGTTAVITDWYQGSDGLLGVTATGEERFRLLDSRRQSDGLNVGRIEIVPEPPRCALAPEDKSLSRLLKRVIAQLGAHYSTIATDYDDAGWVSYRLAEVLPISLELKQTCLELSEPEARLQLLRPAVEQLKVA